MSVMSRHTMERYREFYPDAEVRDAQVAQAHGVEISPELARTLTGRREPTRGKFAPKLETFVLHPERTGIFVIGHGVVTVTFLRLYSSAQRHAALSAYPENVWPLTAEGRW